MINKAFNKITKTNLQADPGLELRPIFALDQNLNKISFNVTAPY